MNEISTKPEILFSAITGPGVFLPRPGYEKIVCSVYSYHPTIYMGYPGLVPKINNATAKKVIQDIPIVGKAISDVRILHDSDFILRCHFGEFWMIMALCSPIFESFTEGGRFLRQYRHTFFSKETLEEWLTTIPRFKKDVNPEVVMRILVAEKIVSGGNNMLTSDLQKESFDILLGNPQLAKKRAQSILTSTGFKNIQGRMGEKELNEFLIAIRLHS